MRRLSLSKLLSPLLVGVNSAGLKRRDLDHPVIIAGIQSVYQKACDLGRFDLVLIDEAHLIPPDGEGMYQTFLRDAQTVNPHLLVIGLTATPFRLKDGAICGEKSEMAVAPRGSLSSVAMRSAARRDGSS